MRRLLAPLASTWLVFQAATLVLASPVLWSEVTAAELACTCEHDGQGVMDATCPMHHGPTEGRAPCQMRRSGIADEDLSVTLMFAPLGLMRTFVSSIAPPASGLQPEARPDAVSNRPLPPDPPPPRG